MNERMLSLTITVALLLGMGIWVPLLEFAAELITSIRNRKTPLQFYDVSVNSSADAQILYSLLINGSSWPRWTQIDSFDLEDGKVEQHQANRGTGQGVGAIRVFRTGRYKSRERILGLILDRQLTYEVLPGSMLRDYHATVQLTPTATGGTDVRWQGSFRMFMPGFAWLMRLYLTNFMQKLVEGLAQHAESRCATIAA